MAGLLFIFPIGFAYVRDYESVESKTRDRLGYDTYGWNRQGDVGLCACGVKVVTFELERIIINGYYTESVIIIIVESFFGDGDEYQSCRCVFCRRVRVMTKRYCEYS